MPLPPTDLQKHTRGRLIGRRDALLRAAALLLCLASLPACAGPQLAPPVDVEKVRFEPGERHEIAGTGVSLELPKPFERKADRAFTAMSGGQVVALLTVEIHALGDRDADSLLDARLETMRRSGLAGVLRDERIELGDLDGRLIEAVDLVGAQRNALMMVATEGEQGLIVAQVIAPVALMKARRDVFEEMLRSVRVAAPSR